MLTLLQHPFDRIICHRIFPCIYIKYEVLKWQDFLYYKKLYKCQSDMSEIMHLMAIYWSNRLTFVLLKAWTS